MEPFLGEIRAFAFGMIPQGWTACQGQVMTINQNQALYALLGNIYGGQASVNFKLPDLRGRTPIHRSATILQGAVGGSETVALDNTTTPAHSHLILANTAAGTDIPPANDVFAGTVNNTHLAYGAAGTPVPVALNAATIDAAGSSAPHNNMQPFEVISYCIATQGLFPQRP